MSAFTPLLMHATEIQYVAEENTVSLQFHF